MDNTTSRPDFGSCTSSIPARSMFTAWFSVYLLFLPVFLFVLYIGFNKWKKPQPSAARGLSHSDVVTLHMVATEITSIVGSCVICYGYYSVNDAVALAGETVFVTAMIGQTLFHCLTCVERYLAVVRPVAYLRLRGEGGVTVRNIGIALVWLFSVVFPVLLRLVQVALFYVACALVLSGVPLLLVIYCSVRVLWALIRPKPGERGVNRKQVDQSKRTTVYTMAAILGVLLLRITVEVVTLSMYLLQQPSANLCLLVMSSFWPALPSSLVLPLLFLHRAGKLTQCK